MPADDRQDSSKSFADLESDYHELKRQKDDLGTSLKRERFGWLVVVIFLLDLFFFRELGTATTICLFVLQLLFLLFASEQAGVRSVFSFVKDAPKAAAGMLGVNPVRGDKEDEERGKPKIPEAKATRTESK